MIVDFHTKAKWKVTDITDVTEIGLHERVTPSPHTLGWGHVAFSMLLSLSQDPIFCKLIHILQLK